MIFGQKKESAPAPPASKDAVFDVDTAGFETSVLKASMDGPVLVDFWAPWCGPCKQLGPVLEAAVRETNGKVRMAKVNIDENPDLAQALRVQSVPTVFAFFQGQPVTAFTGARPAGEIKTLLDQLVKMAANSKPDALNIPETLSAAARALADGQTAQAQNFYTAILAQDENNAPAYAGLVRTFITGGDLEQAGYMLDDAPEAIKKDPALAAARTALELAQAAPQAGAVEKLAAAVEKNATDHAARFALAMALFAAGRRMDAMDALIEIIRRDRVNEQKWEDDKARAQLLRFFEAMGPSDPETIAGRRKLSTLLFS